MLGGTWVCINSLLIFQKEMVSGLRFVRFPPSHLLIKSGYPKDLSNRKIFDYPNSDFSSGSVTNKPSPFLACWQPKGCILNFQCEIITIFRQFWKIFCGFVRLKTFYWDFASFAIKKMINFASDQRGRHESGKVKSNRTVGAGCSLNIFTSNVAVIRNSIRSTGDRSAV